jgi:hypothetical protein
MTVLGTWQGELSNAVRMLSEYVLLYHSVGGVGGNVSPGVHSQVSGSPGDSDVPDDRLQILQLSTAFV